MKIKDKKAFVIYLVLTVVIWQFLISVSKIIKHNVVGGGFFEITETMNTGAAFGAFKENSFVLGIFGLIALLLIVLYVFLNVKFEDKNKILYLAAFSSGILGNTTERLVDGYVTDFIKINLFNFPIFNMFDVLISISILLYAFFYVKDEILKRVGN